jgi:hypothetical protein
MGVGGRQIRKLIPQKYSQFDKLTGGKPYYFHALEKDRQHRLCLYYWFWDRTGRRKNTKRVPLIEIEAAAKQFASQGLFDRNIFHKYCPVSRSEARVGLQL